jgi:hypothetical protein
MKNFTRRAVMRKLIAPFLALLSGRVNSLASDKDDHDSGVVEVTTHFQSLKYTDRRFTCLEDFWREHESDIRYSKAIRGFSRIIGIEGKKIEATICGKSGLPKYVTVYKSMQSYRMHIDLFKRTYQLKETKVNNSVFQYEGEYTITTDTIMLRDKVKRV